MVGDVEKNLLKVGMTQKDILAQFGSPDYSGSPDEADLEQYRLSPKDTVLMYYIEDEGFDPLSLYLVIVTNNGRMTQYFENYY